MQKLTFKTLLISFLLIPFYNTSYAQLKVNIDGNIGINYEPQTGIKTYISQPNSVSGSVGLYVDKATPNFPSSTGYAVNGSIISGVGYSYGMRASANSPTVSSNGRSYGIYAVAGNSTSGFNYGVKGSLYGTNDGTVYLEV